MSALSMTAPQFSKEQEAEERATLSPDEKSWIHNDIFGTSLPTDDTFEVVANETTGFLEELVESTLEQVQALPESQKEAYMEAMVKCPEEVRYVSNPIRFLRCENYLPTSAAQRLTQYWKMRKSVFKDRAFMSMMSLDGTGCLSPFEVGFLEKYGATTYHVLPNDRHGRGVVYLDRRTEKIAWKESGAKKENAVRIFWYLVHTIMFDQDDLSEHSGEYDAQRATKGFVVLLHTNISQMPQYDRMLYKNQYDCMKHAIPFKIRCVHMCNPSNMFKSFAAPCVKFFAGRHIRLRIRIDERLCEKEAPLHEYGMEREKLPETLGGTYIYDSKGWCDEARAKEAQRRTKRPEV